MMRILIYDVETANVFNSGSICSVGWLLLENDQIKDSGYSLINPHCPFLSQNVAIHGITSSDVEFAPSFAEYWESTLKPLMSSCLVVAHNASFDLFETEQALYNAKQEDPGIDYFDTLEMFRNLFRSGSYKLKDLCSLINYEYDAHNALEDVKALYYLLQKIRDAFHFSDFAEMFIRSHSSAENTLSNTYDPHSTITTRFSYDASSRCREDVEIIDHKFTGLRFCITGEIPGYERADIERIIKQHDGRMTGAVSGKTDYLILGTYEDYGSNYVSGKQKAANELINNGGKIQIIDSVRFFAMISDETPENT